MRESERGASSALRRVARARNVVLRLGTGPDHRHHYSERADVQRPGDEMIVAARHASHRQEVEPATPGELGLQGFEFEPRVLHVVEHELGAGILADLRQTRREELEDHGAARATASRKSLLYRVVSHVCIKSGYQSSIP